jgi:signal peptidase II
MTRARLVFPLALALVAADCTTKELAVEALSPEQVPHQVVGNVVRFTLAYNRGAAMSLPIGPRPVLVALSCVVLGVLLWMLWKAPGEATLQRLALGLILGGALGNLGSRVLDHRGVVDFIDIGYGAWRFYTFNVADIGVVTGSLLLAWALYREERAGPSAGALR